MTRQQYATLAGDRITIRSPVEASDALDFLDWAGRRDRLGLDTEATGKLVYDPEFKVRLVQFGDAHESWCLPVDEGFNWAIKRVLNDQSKHWVLHNAPFDIAGMHRHGLINGFEFIDRCDDSYIPSHLADPRDLKDGGVGHKLKDQVQYRIDPSATDGQEELHRVFKEEIGVKKQAEGWAKIHWNHPAYLYYSGLDPVFAWRLWDHSIPDVVSSKQDHLLDREHLVQQITTRMTLRGLLLDVEYATGIEVELADEYAYWTDQALVYGVENVNSNAQVAEALMQDGWKPDKFTPKSGDPELKNDILEDLAEKGFPLAKIVVQAKRAEHYNNSYVRAMLKMRDTQDRVHPMIAALRARTSRMSISNPPFQQLPSEDALIRLAILADPGWSIVSADYSQVEMRVLAGLSKETKMISGIREGKKLHDIVATMMFGAGYTDKQYKLAKNTGFGEVFGGGAKTLARQAGVTLDKAKEAKKIFSDGFPGIRQYSLWLMEWAKANDFVVTNPYGRRLPVDKDRLYSATNYMVQSSARDLFCEDLITMSEIGLEDNLLLPVHDEVLAQAPDNEAEELAREIEMVMSRSDWNGVPIVAEAEVYGRSWGDGYGDS